MVRNMTEFKALSVKTWFGDINNIGIIVAVVEIREKAIKVYHEIGSGIIKTAWIPKSVLVFDKAYNEAFQINCDECDTIEEAIQKNYTTDDYATIAAYHRDLHSMYI